MSHRTNYIHFCQPSPPKLHHIHIHLYTFYYHISQNQFHPIILSKPNSTQKPYYFPEFSPSFDNLDTLIKYYQLNSSNPLLP
jgi:hypothetical protein